jgi:sporulation protein YlmC with PRC-barrel domain
MWQRKSAVLALVAAAGLVFAAAAQAETGGKPVDFHLYKASALSSTRVYNPAGEDLGKITDLVMTSKDGKIVYAALSYGGVAGIGSKMFAVPWDALALFEKDKNMYFVLNCDKAKLDNATGFKNEDWPTEPDRSFSQAAKPGEDKVETGARKAKDAIKDTAENIKEGAGVKREILRTSGVNGTKVKNENGEDLGKIYDLVFDTKKGQMSYAVLAYGGVAGVGSKWFAMDWSGFKLDSINLKPNERVLVCNVDKATLENAQGFDSNNWPHEPDQRFTKKPAR